MKSNPTGFTSQILRRVHLPEGIPGSVWLTSMPGHQRPLQEFFDSIGKVGIATLVCLAGGAELVEKSPEYVGARDKAGWPFVSLDFPIPDLGVPQNKAAFAGFIRNLAKMLTCGDAIVIHCAAGIGRTGLTAMCLLIALGLPSEAAVAVVEAAGSHPETPLQRQFTMSFCPCP